MLEGIDASVYQGRVDWQQVSRAGKSFAFVKATEGLEYQDPTFPHNWQALRDNGIVRGAYHYFRPYLDAVDQADHLHAYVRTNGHFIAGDFVVVDAEVMDGRPPDDVIAKLEAFILRCREMIAKSVVVYTYPDYWLNQLGNPVSDVFSRCPLWLADYGPTVPTLAAWPNGLSFWQYSQTGHCPGVNGAVDLSRFYGTMAELRVLEVFSP